MATKKTQERYVLIRGTGAGVWAGILISRNSETSVTLRDGRRIWRWRGANTLSEVSQRGVAPASDGHTRVACPVPIAEIVGVCEVLDVSAAARASIETVGWAP